MSSYKEILKRYWGYDDFRGIQREIIESIGLGHDTLGLMPTGGGKSITFQVPALAMEGVCIVITPLIALMKDQVHHLRRRGIFAAAIYSGMQHDEILRTLDNCILGRTKFLYVSPERLTSELFVTKLRHMRISFLTVDEAHCISQWGYDFRPSYLEIANIRTLLPDIPVLALTATATPQVVDDICEKLTLHATQNAPHSTFNVFRMSFERANLTYLVRHVADKEQELIHILSHTTGAAIVYVRSRRRSKELATALVKAGLEATFYHAGLESDDKDQRQQAWTKPDVRLVVHYDCPDSIEAYFQEAGRAGRDGQQAYAVLLYNNSDNSKLQQRIDDNFPPREYIRQVYEHLAYYYQIALGDGFGITREFNIDQFCTRFHHFPTRVHSALHILQRAGYIEYDEAPDLQTRVQFLLERQELYRLKDTTPDEERVIVALLRNYGGLFADLGYIDESLIAHDSGIQAAALHQVLTALAQQHIIRYIPRRQIPTIHYLQRRDDPEHIHLSREIYEDRMEQYRLRINAIQHYAQSNGRCRSRMLLEYFGEQNTHNCGHCDVCREQQGNAVDADQLTAAQQAILQLLADHKPHHTTLLHQLPLPSEAIDAALVTLLQDEQIKQEDGFLLLA